jgi:phytoene desaturase
MAGLAAALQVIRAGVDCVLLEAAPRIGGCCATLDLGGRTFEPAASIVIGREMLTSVFDPLHVDVRSILRPVLPVISLRWPGGRFDFDGPVEAFLSSITPTAGIDRERAERFFNGLTRLSAQLLPALNALRRRTSVAAAIGSMPFVSWIARSYRSVVRQHFTNPILVFALEAFSEFYAGLPARKAPAIMGLIPALAISEGCFEVVGGVQRLPDLLAEHIYASGATIQTSTPALRLIVKGNRVTEVETSSGMIQTRGVVAACDIRRTLRLLPALPALAAMRLHIRASKPSVSVLSVLGTWGGAELLPPMTWALPSGPPGPTARVGRDDPCGLLPLVAVTRTSGPLERHGLRVGGAMQSRRSITVGEALAGAEYLLELLGRAGVSLRLRDVKVWRPADYEENLGLPGGCAFGIEPSRHQLGPLRYGPRTPIANLTVAGQSCFPGFGIPMTAFSGQLAADILLAT